MTGFDPGAPLTEAEITATSRRRMNGSAPAQPEALFDGQSPEFAMPESRPYGPSGWVGTLGQPDLISEYRYADGSLAFVICRWEAGHLGTDPGSLPTPTKTIRPCSWDGTRWRWTHTRPKPRPLLDAPDIVAHPSAPVLVLEGEKKAKIAHAYLPPGWLVTSWAGGAPNWSAHDWTLLQGHPVVIWPDNNDVGKQAAVDIEANLHSLKIAASVMPLPPWLAPGWDLGDELPAKWSPDIVMRALARQLRRCDVPPPIEINRTDDTISEDAPGLEDAEQQFQALGACDGEFFFLSKISGRVEVLTAGALLSKTGPLQIVPDTTYWAGRTNAPARKIDWTEIGATLMRNCYDAGVFRPRRLRGRGGWIDEGRVVFHNGDAMWVDGALFHPSEVKSHWIYPQEDRFGDVDLTKVEPLSDDEGHQILDICHALRWEQRMHGFYLAGWLACAPVCGLLRWRPHIWITGTKGSGKSFVLNDLVARIMGPFALNVKGATTEAGIRSTLDKDARPVIFDEAEPGDNQQTQGRMESVIELIRQASAETDAEVLKGSAHHVARAFNIRSSFLCGSIAVPLVREADESRFMVCTLRPPATGPDASEHFRSLVLQINSLRPDIAARLLKRQLLNAHNIRASADTIAAAIVAKQGTRRLGDQVGTLLAGVWSLLHREPIRPAQAEEWVERLMPKPDEHAAAASQDDDEAVRLLRAFLSNTVRVALSHRTVERSMGELLAVAARTQNDDSINFGDAEKALARIGVRLVEDQHAAPGVALAINHPGTEAAFSKSPYSMSWARILGRMPGAFSLGRMVYAGTPCRGVFIPRAAMIEPPDGQGQPAPIAPDELDRLGFQDRDLPF